MSNLLYGQLPISRESKDDTILLLSGVAKACGVQEQAMTKDVFMHSHSSGWFCDAEDLQYTEQRLEELMVRGLVSWVNIGDGIKRWRLTDAGLLLLAEARS